MLRYGIPAYRLPAEYLDRDINSILSTGVEVQTDCDIGKDITLEQLRQDYDSVYMAIGASKHKGLGIPGEDAKGVLSAIELLDSTIRVESRTSPARTWSSSAAATWPWTPPARPCVWGPSPSAVSIAAASAT